MKRIFFTLGLVFMSLSIVHCGPELPKEKGTYAAIRTTQGDIIIQLLPEIAPKTVENFIGLAAGTKEWTDPKSGQKKKAPFYNGLSFHRVIPNFMAQGGCPLNNGTGSPGYSFEDEISAKALGLDQKKVKDNLSFVSRDIQLYLQKNVYPKLGIKSQQDLDKNKKKIEVIQNEILEKWSVMKLLEENGHKFQNELKSIPAGKGILAMANSGPNTNGSQFFINQVDTPWLNGKHTVFARVTKGLDVLDKIIAAGNNKTKIDKIIIQENK